MIIHDYKLIFIHIPRTGGTRFEDLFNHPRYPINSHDESRYQYKHLVASTARELYGEWWDKYYKVSIIRNPYDLAVSQSKFGGIYRIGHNKGGSDNKYKLILPDKMVPQYRLGWIDRRSPSRKILETISNDGFPAGFDPNGYLSNILNEDLDFIARHENYVDDIKHILKTIDYKDMDRAEMKLNIRDRMSTPFRRAHNDHNTKYSYRKYYTPRIKDIITDVYKSDLKKYNYKW